MLSTSLSFYTPPRHGVCMVGKENTTPLRRDVSHKLQKPQEEESSASCLSLVLEQRLGVRVGSSLTGCLAVPETVWHRLS